MTSPVAATTNSRASSLAEGLTIRTTLPRVSITYKIASVIFLIMLAAMACFSVFETRRISDEYHRDEDSRLEQLVRTLTPILSESLWSYSTNIVESTLKAVFADQSMDGLEILDTYERVALKFSRDATRNVVMAPLRPDSATNLKNSITAHILTSTNSAGDTVYTTAIPSPQGTGAPNLGVLKITFSGRPLAVKVAAAQRRTVIFASVLGLLVFAVVLLGNRRFIIGPIRSIATQIAGRAVTASHLPHVKDEILLLGTFFNNLLLQIRSETSARIAVEADAARSAAIARMTGMLAHDVRKPFSILRIGLDMLGSIDDPAQAKELLAKLVPEIDRATSSVNGLISDVMEVGSTSTQLIQEPVSPESLIESALGEIFRVYPKSSVSIAYDLHHSHMVNVHVNKVGRVFSNIIGNAVQAMRYKGQIWFKTREVGEMVEFSIGNAGSMIPAETLPKLFEAFFTSGKKGGTGLGLAIAEKVVTAHGGRIWCESSKSARYPDGYVEFKFTLPVSPLTPNQTTASLPIHSSEITINIAKMAEAARTSKGVDKGELTLEEDIKAVCKQLGRPLRVLVVDDESVYRRGIYSALARTPDFAEIVSLTEADGSTQALALVEKVPFDLVITDIDMGPASLNGFDLVAKLREIPGFKARISVHSNRIVADDQKEALLRGADSFIPKPIARGQLLKLLLQASMRLMGQPTNEMESTPAPAASRVDVAAAGGPPTVERARDNRPQVAVVEDTTLILTAWGRALNADSTPHLFKSPEEFWAAIEADTTLLGRLSAVITDQNFDNSTQDGLAIAAWIKERVPTLPVLLCSSADFTDAQLAGRVNKVIPKQPVKFDHLPL